METPLEKFLAALILWATTQTDLQALALVGSHARHTATPTSDVDLVLITHQPQKYLQQVAWAQQFGTILRTQVEDYGKLTSLRVWYANEREVEYGFTDPSWLALPLDAGTQRVLSDGVQILFERHQLLSHAYPKKP